MKTPKEKSPIITIGRYYGTPINQLPNSYLRWMITQKFKKEWLEAARKKLEDSSYNDLYLHVSRHAIDMFSKRFLSTWINSEYKKGESAVGLASFIAILAQEAWDKGGDISKYRHQDDGVVREFKGIKWVFGVNPNYPDYRDVITVMGNLDE